MFNREIEDCRRQDKKSLRANSPEVLPRLDDQLATKMSGDAAHFWFCIHQS